MGIQLYTNWNSCQYHYEELLEQTKLNHGKIKDAFPGSNCEHVSERCNKKNYSVHTSGGFL